MTTPEENRPKTTSTDQVVADTGTDDTRPHQEGASGRTIQEAMEEAGVHREDFEEK
ncbi:hypothetical protein SALBM135S_08043 [Streptomyces alboniger]